MSDWIETVVHARRGDVEAFDLLVRRFQGMAIGYAYSILGDFHLAQDAVQSGFVEAYENLGNLREPTAFPDWFRKIIFKHCDRLTRGKRLPTVSLDAAAEVPAASPEPQLLAEQRELKDRVLRAVNSLPDHQRAATTLFYINGHTQSEVAGFLGVSLSTLKNWLYAARGNLREEMIGVLEETLRENAPGESFSKTLRGKLETVQWVHRQQTHLGCLQGCLHYLGADVSPGWLCGGSGWAFAMRIHRELCPAGIIAWGPPAELGRNVGYDTEGLAPQDDDVAKQQEIVWTATNKALDEGRPCIGFAMEAWQSYIIYGYDDTGYFYRPASTGDGHFSKEKMGTEVPCVMSFIRLVEPSPDAVVVRQALDFAVRFATDPDAAPGWGGPPEDFVSGMAAYDEWIDAIQSGRADGHGAAYNAAVYADLRRLAVDFLKEAGERLGMKPFSQAVENYGTLAAHLERLAELIPLPADPAHMREPERCRPAIEQLHAARQAEEEGLKCLQVLLERLAA